MQAMHAQVCPEEVQAEQHSKGKHVRHAEHQEEQHGDASGATDDAEPQDCWPVSINSIDIHDLACRFAINPL